MQAKINVPMIDNIVDINENDILKQLGQEVVECLLIDHTTHHNIFWATNDYASLGAGYQYRDEITIGAITGDNCMVVRPRCVKTKAEQASRIKDKAEVFTPSWICNEQNNLIDDAWFGRANVFNKPIINDAGQHDWIITERPIVFDDVRGRDWLAYVRDTRMEITCGEAPYLVSRYDTTTGEPIPIEKRIGLLDRKLQVISEHVHTSEEWLEKTQIAYKSTYGYEWQGDNLLLAREALLFTFIDYYKAKFGRKPNLRSVRYIAYIVSWNIWQMDGLKMVIPGSCEEVYSENLMGEKVQVECKACKEGKATHHIGIQCVIRDWKKTKAPVNWKGTPEQRKNKEWQKIPFVYLMSPLGKNEE